MAELTSESLLEDDLDQTDGCDVPGSRRSSKVTYNWTDITDEFSQACLDLQLGELCHDSVFGLFEAMGAIEMMDPKMDAGMMCNQVKRKVFTFETALKDGSLKVADLSHAELIGIFDDTLAGLATWLEGHSLAQTVFTNLYLHKPYAIEDRALKAFSICILKTVAVMRERINRASVFEEEDFQPMVYGFKLAHDITELRAIGMVKEVEDDLNRIVKNTRSKAGEERDKETEEKHELTLGVYARLRLSRLFLSSLLAFSKEKCQGIPEAMKHLVQMQELIPSVRKTLTLGIQPAQLSEESHDYATIMGFEPLVNQRLLPPTFPRYTKIKSRQETVDYMEQLIHVLKLVCSITEIPHLHQVVDFMVEFSKPAPCVLSRSLLQLTVLPQNRRWFGSQQMLEVIRNTIRTFIAPPVLMPKCAIATNPQAKEYVDAFLTHSVMPICNICQITGNNRARQRDKWGHLLEDLAQLQDEADKVDAFLHSLLVKHEPGRQHLACFGTWVLYHTLQVMLHYLLAGFELELYAVHEYHYIFWYLYECLYNWIISTLTRADNFVIEYEAYADQQQKGKNKKSKKKRKTRPHAKQIAEAQALHYLCAGYYKAIVGFTIDGKLQQPQFDFDSEEVRYNHRFAPFGNLITPPPVTYVQFKEMTDYSRYDRPPTGPDMLQSSRKSFQQAISVMETIPSPSQEMQTLLKVCKRNLIVVNLVLGGHKKDSLESPEFDFTQHNLFPVFKI